MLDRMAALSPGTPQLVVHELLDRVQRSGEPVVFFPSSHLRDLEVLVDQIRSRGLRMAGVPHGCITVLPSIPLDDDELWTICHLYCCSPSEDVRAELRGQLYLRDYPRFRAVEGRGSPLYHPADIVVKIAQLCFSMMQSTTPEQDLGLSPYFHVSPVREICAAIRTMAHSPRNPSASLDAQRSGMAGGMSLSASHPVAFSSAAVNGSTCLPLSDDGSSTRLLATLPTAADQKVGLFQAEAIASDEEAQEPENLTGSEVVDSTSKRVTEYLTAADFELVTESAIFFDGEGDNKRLAAIYVTNAIDADLCREAARVLEPAATKKNLRAATNGGEPPDTGIVGYYDYLNNPTVRKCRETEFMRNNWPAVMESTAGFLQSLNQLYKECAPVHHSLQRAAIPSEYQLHDTVFSTVTVNRNFRTAVHTDTGDFRSGLGLVCVVNGEFEGCHLAIKRLGRAFRMQVGDVLLFDTALEHGNTEVLSPDGSWSRTSVVCYLRNGLMSSVCELERRRQLNRRLLEQMEHDQMFDSTININSASSSLPPLYVPVALAPRLAPVQLAALSFVTERLHKGSGSVVAMTMGLGKTLVALSLCYSFMHAHSARDVLILTPKAVIGHWAAEHQKWSRMGLYFPHFVHSGAVGTSAFEDAVMRYEQRLCGTTTRAGHVFVLNPEYALSFLKRVKHFDPALVIVDEGHRVANKGSKLSEALDKLRCRLRVVLTGTPIQNDAKELYSLVRWVNEEVAHVMPVSRFDELSECIGRYIDGDDASLPLAVASQRFILDWMRGFVFREMENDLPPLHDYLVVCGSSASQRAFAEEIGVGARDATTPVAANEFRPYHLATHPICYLSYIAGCYLSMCGEKVKRGPRHDKEYTGVHRYLSDADLEEVEKCYAQIQQNQVDSFLAMSGKLTVLAEIVKQVKSRNEKVIIFSQYVGSQDLIHRTLTALNILAFTIRGRDSQERRRKAMSQFFTDPDLMVLVLSTKIAAYGLDFTVANHVVLFDSWWNPQVDAQAVARAYRRNQTKPVTVYRLASEVEDMYILRTQTRKLALFQCIMYDRTSRQARPSEVSDCADTEPDEARHLLWGNLKARQLEGGGPALLRVYRYGDGIREEQEEEEIPAVD